MFKRRVKSDYSLARRQERECIYRCLTCPSGCPPTNINFCSFALCTITLNRSSLLHLDIRFKYKVVSSRLTFYVEKSVFTRSLLPPPVRVHFSLPVVGDTLETRGPKRPPVLRGVVRYKAGANTPQRAREFWNVPDPFSSVLVRMRQSEPMSEWSPSIVSPAVIRWPLSWPLSAIAEPQRRRGHFDASTYRSLIHSRVPGHQARNSDENGSHRCQICCVRCLHRVLSFSLFPPPVILNLPFNFPIICGVKRRSLSCRYGCLSNNQQRRHAFKTLDPTDPNNWR